MCQGPHSLIRPSSNLWRGDSYVVRECELSVSCRFGCEAEHVGIHGPAPTGLLIGLSCSTRSSEPTLGPGVHCNVKRRADGKGEEQIRFVPVYKTRLSNLS